MAHLVNEYTSFENDVENDPPFEETDYLKQTKPANDLQKLKAMFAWAQMQD
jgi:hypothetical protein